MKRLLFIILLFPWICIAQINADLGIQYANFVQPTLSFEFRTEYEDDIRFCFGAHWRNLIQVQVEGQYVGNQWFENTYNTSGFGLSFNAGIQQDFIGRYINYCAYLSLGYDYMDVQENSIHTQEYNFGGQTFTSAQGYQFVHDKRYYLVPGFEYKVNLEIPVLKNFVIGAYASVLGYLNMRVGHVVISDPNNTTEEQDKIYTRGMFLAGGSLRYKISKK